MRICLIDDNDVYFYAHDCGGKQMISLYNEIQVPFSHQYLIFLCIVVDPIT